MKEKLLPYLWENKLKTISLWNVGIKLAAKSKTLSTADALPIILATTEISKFIVVTYDRRGQIDPTSQYNWMNTFILLVSKCLQSNYFITNTYTLVY